MNETIEPPTIVEHDTIAVWMILCALALLTLLSSAQGGLASTATRLVVAALSGA